MLVGKNVQGQSADVLAAVVVVMDRGKGSTLHQGVGDLRRKVVGRRRHHVGQVPHPAVVARRRRALAHNVAANGEDFLVEPSIVVASFFQYLRRNG